VKISYFTAAGVTDALVAVRDGMGAIDHKTLDCFQKKDLARQSVRYERAN
jgi:hypothetical protein